MKILERIVDGLIRQVVSIDDSQFGFVPARGTTDAIFVVRQLQEKYLAVNNSGHYSCENSLEEVQGATTSSHILPPLLQDAWPCIQLLPAECHAPCQ